MNLLVIMFFILKQKMLTKFSAHFVSQVSILIFGNLAKKKGGGQNVDNMLITKITITGFF